MLSRILPFVLIPAFIGAGLAFRRPTPSESEIPHYGLRPTSDRIDAIATPASALDAAQLARGQQIYAMLCQACHLPDGQGMMGALPPLARSDFLLADQARAGRTVLHGLSGSITVNGIGYNAAMPALGGMLSDQQVADVLTYVFNSWGNTGPGFTAAQVRAWR